VAGISEATLYKKAGLSPKQQHHGKELPTHRLSQHFSKQAVLHGEHPGAGFWNLQCPAHFFMGK
jgi:hypothetical protein